MISSDEFARELFEDAKACLISAKSESIGRLKQRHLRHALLAGFSFLELQIDLIGQHFQDSEFFTLHERSMINQREIVFEKGTFRLKHTPKFFRLTDRMLLLQHKFEGSMLTERSWWAGLRLATERRNSVAHPRNVLRLDEADVEEALSNILECVNDLFKIVFHKGLPYAGLGTKPKVTA